MGADVQPTRTSPARPSPRPRNIVFMVSDGMSAGVPTLAEPFSQIVRDRGTNWAALARDSSTTHGMFDMASLNSLVPDSAAAVSAWATGSRVTNGSINMLPDGTELVPIGVLAKDAGKRLGLVTTTRVTHATPAGFASVVPGRGLEVDIAEQYLNVVDLMLGGGSNQFLLDLDNQFRQAGYQMLTSRQELLTLPALSDKVLGLFDRSHLPYALERRHSLEIQRQVPTLAEMSRAALRALDRHPSGFLLQIEGGRVDHAAHANDAAALMWEQLDFDDALGVVREFIVDRDDTLVIICTDHGNANPGLNGLGGGYRDSTPSFNRLASITDTVDNTQRKVFAARRTRDVVQAIKHVTGLDITSEEAEALFESSHRRPVTERNRLLASFRGQYGQIVGNHTGVTFTGTTHTADWAMCMAIGPGREHFSGLMRSTDAFVRMTELMNIHHSNPRAESV